MIRQPNSNETIPFNDNTIIPGIIHASDYDLGTNGYAYNDSAVSYTHLTLPTTPYV